MAAAQRPPHPSTDPAATGRVALLFANRWLEAPVIDSLRGAGLAPLRHADAAALVAALHQTRIDLALVEDSGNHFLHSMTTLRFRGTATVPIVAVGRGTPQEIVRAVQQGASDYAVLGETMPLLVHRVQARLAIDRQAHAPSMVRAGACWLEAASRSLRHPAGELALTPIEFSIAWALFQHAGQVVNLQALTQQVWGREAEVSKRTVEQHVSRLRAKLVTAAAAAGERISLQAIHNVGYRLLVTSERTV